METWCSLPCVASGHGADSDLPFEDIVSDITRWRSRKYGGSSRVPGTKPSKPPGCRSRRCRRRTWRSSDAAYDALARGTSEAALAPRLTPICLARRGLDRRRRLAQVDEDPGVLRGGRATAWEILRARAEELIGGWRSRLRRSSRGIRGKGSGVEARCPTSPSRLSVRARRPVTGFRARAEALEAAGLSGVGDVAGERGAGPPVL